MKTELKPCPFCGGKAKFDEQYKGIYVVRCSVCGIRVMESAIFAEPEEIIGAWNRRAGNDIRKELEKMNHMEQVAKMLGVELGERFKVMRQGAISSSEFCITENGLYEKFRDQSSINSPVLKNLLIGDAEIVKIPWKPKDGEKVWLFSWMLEDVESYSIDIDAVEDLALYKLGKLYYTREEAEAHAEEDKAYWNEIRKELEE